MYNMLMQPTFESLYNNLNTAQKQAVDAIEGPVMVVAGPGTGKTSILTLRIANILKKTDTAPENILALTFTESGAKAMRKKLVNIVGSQGYKVRISTFHGFCNGLIKEFPEQFERIIGSTSITDVDQIKIVEDIILKTDFEFIKPYGEPLFYLKSLLNLIKTMKREAISIKDLEQSVAQQKLDFKNIPDLYHEKGAHKGKMKGEYIDLEKQINKNTELITVYEAYEKVLKKDKLYDYEDMIIETIKAFKNDADFLLQVQETYQYIMADEHQDANNAQNTILELLSSFHPDPNLFIVGDEKQAIYRFQGASLENFLYFKKIYPSAKLVHLEENYRSTQNILDASHSLILNNKTNPTALRSNIEHKAPISVVECRSPLHEERYIAESIKESYQETAILYRDNKDAFSMAQTLQKYGIPYTIESDQDLLSNEHIKRLLYLLRLAHDPSREDILAKVLFFEHDALEVVKAIESARKEKRHLLDFNLLPNLKEWVKRGKNKPFLEFFEWFIKDSGYMAYAVQESERFDVLTAFYDEIKNLVMAKKEYYLSDFIDHITLIETHGLLIKTAHKEKTGVRLMTAHKSKGLEFEYVYILGANDGHWGGRKRRTYFHVPLLKEDSGESQDERRLFYVAITRARKEVTITYHTENDAIPTEFISEIDPALIEKKVGTFTDDGKFMFKDKEVKIKTILDVETIKEKFLDQGIAVTGLNNYLECAWKYFFVNLVRIPQAPSKHQLYGIAIHETLRAFFNHYKEEKEFDALKFFEKKLSTMPLYDDYKDTLEKGKEALSAYLKNKVWNKNILTEYSVEQDLDGITVKGNLDKIEIIDDRKVNVVDYKTGKKKTENKEKYARQLQFYKMLLDLDQKYNMVSGELDYIESNKVEKYEDIDTTKIIETTKEVSSKIMNGDFSGGCNEKDCEFCELAKLLQQ